MSKKHKEIDWATVVGIVAIILVIGVVIAAIIIQIILNKSILESDLPFWLKLKLIFS